MPLVKGLRVVRGLSWKWGGQDGGEGSVGTVVGFKNEDSGSSRAQKNITVKVIWDNGAKGFYPVGPEGAHNLLIVDSAATGVKHNDVPCHSCTMPEILGMRWQCTECSANFCSSCFYRIKELHNQHYKSFHRYDSPESEPVLRKLDAEIKKVELRGIYERAKVTRGRDWFYGKEDDDRIGEVLKSLTHNIVRVKWAPGNIRSYRRGKDGKVDLKVVEAAVGGHYDPLWLPIFESRKSSLQKNDTENNRKTLFVGDLVQIDLTVERFREKQAESGGWHPEMSTLISLIGTVREIGSGTVTVQFDGSDKTWFLNPVVLKKISQFSIGQIVRVKDDHDTFKAIQSTLGNKIACSLATEIGRIASKNQLNKTEENMYLELMDLQSKDIPMRPEWLEPVPVSIQLHEKFYQMKSNMVDLLIEAAREDDFYLVRELVTYHNVSVDSGRKVDGLTALHLACFNGHLTLIRWLFEKKADLEKPDVKGRRAIYFAVKGCQPEVLKLLIQKGVELDPLTKKRKLSPFLKAVDKQYIDCAQILMDNNCNINHQDEDGDTALHKATFSKMPLFEALIQCDRVDLNLMKNKKGYNIFHLAVLAGNVRVVQHLLDRQESLALERVGGSQHSALHSACTKGDLQVVHLLLERFKEKLSVNDADRMDRTALMMACRRGHDDDELDDEIYLNGSTIHTHELAKAVVNEGANPRQQSVKHNYQTASKSSTAEKASPAIPNLLKGNTSTVSPTATSMPQQNVIPTLQKSVPPRTTALDQSWLKFLIYFGLKVDSDQLPTTSIPDKSPVGPAKSLELAVVSKQLSLNYKVIGKNIKQDEVIQDPEGNTYTKRSTGKGVLQCTKKQADSKNRRCTALLFQKDNRWYHKGVHRCLKEAPSSTSSSTLPSNKGKKSWMMEKSRDLQVPVSHGFSSEAGLATKRFKRLDSTLAPLAKRMAMRPDCLAEEAAGVGDVNLVRKVINRQVVPVDAAINLARNNTQLKLAHLVLEETKADLEEAGKKWSNLNLVKSQISKGIVMAFITSILTDGEYTDLETFILLNFCQSDQDEIDAIRKLLFDEFGDTMERCPYLAFICYIYALDEDSNFIATVKALLRDEKVSEVLDYYVQEF